MNEYNYLFIYIRRPILVVCTEVVRGEKIRNASNCLSRICQTVESIRHLVESNDNGNIVWLGLPEVEVRMVEARHGESGFLSNDMD